MNIQRIACACLALAGAALLGLAPSAAWAEIQPSSEVMLPYFEVDLRGIPDISPTTLFALCNDGDEAVDVQVTIRTNWGIPVLDVHLTLLGDEVRSVNLRDWLVAGQIPGMTLSAEELAHLRAALSGKPSPKDQLYRSTEVAPDLAVGAITFSAIGPGHKDVLWGDSFIIDPKIGFAEGETLINVDSSRECLVGCTRHGIRFLSGAAFDAGTELMFWTKHVAMPSSSPDLAGSHRIRTEARIYDESGRLIDQMQLSLLPIERLTVADLGLTTPVGWIDLVTSEDAFILGHYSANDRYGAALHAWCLPAEEQVPGPGIHLEKLTEGAAADVPPGPRVPVGGTVHWTYVVTNTGDVPLSDVVVTDSDGVLVSCPGDTLAPDESMECTATGTAVACGHSNTATATGKPPAGGTVEDSDVGNYYGERQGELSLRAMLNGDDANTPPGPEVAVGAAVHWTYEVTNTGQYPLSGVAVTDQHGAPVSCPKTTLSAGAAMTCTANGTATAGQHSFLATAVGAPECGPQVSATDPTSYHTPPPPDHASIAIKKMTNGEDANTPPGPTLVKGAAVAWTYLVTNTGGVPLANVTVTDDRGVVVSCPQATLAAGQSMTCTGSGTAATGQYANIGTATGTPPGGGQLSATDPSHYFGVWPAIDIEKLTNGQDADTAPGPTVSVGSTVTWTYVVTNTGDQPLSQVAVTDSQGVAVTCPQTTLAPAQSMTCTASGKAIEGQYENLGTATGTPALGPTVSDSDPSHYFGRVTHYQGCTSGFWKAHLAAWPATGYASSQPVVSVFAEASRYPSLGSSTLLQALSFDGGAGLDGAAEILLRAGVAAVLNAAHPSVAYPRTVADVVANVDAALASDNRDAMVALAALLDADNIRGCPLY